MEEYCQNPTCDNKAVKEVPVSVEKPSDQTRSLCASCEGVYTWGVQHGTMLEGLKIASPPEEMGDEPLFRVVYMIDVNSGEVRLWVNGEEVSGGTESQPSEGFLCLESEGAPVDFKNLRIRELS